jgi:hypothetical protein
MWDLVESWLTGIYVLAALCPSLAVLPLLLCFAKKLVARVGLAQYWIGIGLHAANGLTLAAMITFLGKQCAGCASGVMLFLGIPLWWTLFVVGVLLVLVPLKKRGGTGTALGP